MRPSLPNALIAFTQLEPPPMSFCKITDPLPQFASYSSTYVSAANVNGSVVSVMFSNLIVTLVMQSPHRIRAGRFYRPNRAVLHHRPAPCSRDIEHRDRCQLITPAIAYDGGFDIG